MKWLNNLARLVLFKRKPKAPPAPWRYVSHRYLGDEAIAEGTSHVYLVEYQRDFTQRVVERRMHAGAGRHDDEKLAALFTSEAKVLK